MPSTRLRNRSSQERRKSSFEVGPALRAGLGSGRFAAQSQGGSESHPTFSRVFRRAPKDRNTAKATGCYTGGGLRSAKPVWCQYGYALFVALAASSFAT